MAVIGPLELQLLVNSAGFKQQLARETSAGMAEMNRVVKTAVGQADKEFTGLGANAGKTLTANMRAAAADTVKAWKGTGDKIEIELKVDGRATTKPILDAAQAAAKQIPREYDGVDTEIARQLDVSDSVFQGITDAASTTADRLPEQFSGAGTEIGRTIDREVDALNIGTDVEATVQVDRASVASDVAAAVASADARVDVDTSGIAADVSAAVDSARPQIRLDTAGITADVTRAAQAARPTIQVDEADITRQVDEGIERAGDAPLNLTHLTEQVRQAVQQGITSGDVSVGADSGRGSSPLGALGDTGLIRDFSIAAAADRLDDSAAARLTSRAVIDPRALSASVASAVSSGAVAGIKVSAPRTLADEVKKAVEDVQIRPQLDTKSLSTISDEWVKSDRVKLIIDQAALAAQVKEAVESAPVAPQLDARRLSDQWVQSDAVRNAVSRAAETVRPTLASPDAARTILGADDRAALKITPDYAEVARELKRTVEQADIEIPVDWDGVRRDAERELAQADIKLPGVEQEVRRSILEGVDKATAQPIKIHADPITLAADMEKAVKGASDEPIRLHVDIDRLGADIRRIQNQADIKIGVQVETKEITAAERAFASFRAKLQATNVELDVDYDEIQEAFRLAERLDGLVAEVDVTTDKRELEEAFRLATSLESFAAQIDLRTNGLGELQEALRTTDALERIATVSIAVKGSEDLREAGRLADNLERTRTVPIDARKEDLVRLSDSISEAGAAGAEGVAESLGDIDYANIGGSALDQLTGAIGAAGPWGAVAAGIGAIFGDEFLTGFNNALPDSRGDTVRALRSNLSDADIAEVGKAGGAAYSAGLTEGLGGAKDAAALIKGELGDIDKSLDLTEATRQVTALEATFGVFGVDVATLVASVDKLIQQGLVKNAEEGFNLLFELGQQTQGEFGEMLELTNEFSTAIRALGIDGPKGLKLIGQMVEQGIFPQVDQAGEVFEELNETIINGGAHDALQTLTGDATKFEDAIAGGGPKAAAGVAEIAKQLLAVDDNTKQAQLTSAIFGDNMGLLGDEAREAALQLFATADGTEAVGTGATDAAKDIEEAASGLDRMKRIAIELGGELGTLAGDGIDAINAITKGDWDTAAKNAGEFGAALVERVIIPLSALGVELPGDPFGKLSSGFDTLKDKIEGIDLGPLGDLSAKIFGTGDEADTANPKLARHSDLVKGIGEAGRDAAGGLDETAAAVQGLDDAMSDFAGRFDKDQVMRKLREESDAAIESVKEMTGASFELGAGFDISTEAGRNAEGAMEDLSGSLDDMIGLAKDGKISADDLAAGQRNVEGTLRAVASQLGLTQDETDFLIRKYASVPDDVYTNLRAVDYATQVVKNLQDALAGLKDKTITVTTRNAVIAATAATAGKRAGGGPTRGLTLLGEEGPELADFTGPAFIYTASQTKQLLSSGAVRAYALGGLADQPSIFGEDGLELALPLTKPERLKELLAQYGPLITNAVNGQPLNQAAPAAVTAAATAVPWYQAGRTTPPAPTTEVPWYQLGRTAGNSDSSALTGLYKDALGAAVNTAGTAYMQAVTAGSGPAADTLAVDDFLGSPEARTLLTQTANQATAESAKNAQYIDMLYLDVLGRVADESGRAYWQGILDSGQSTRAGVEDLFRSSAERVNLEAATAGVGQRQGYTDAEYIAQLYRHVLGRAADETGAAYWTSLLGAQGAVRENIAEAFLESAESGSLLAATGQIAGTAGGTDAEFIERLYRDILHRASDEAGRTYWSDLLANQGLTRDDVTYDFWASTEAGNLLSSTATVAATAGQTDAQFIDQLYRDILGRTADEAGAAYWGTLLSGQAATREEIAASFAASNEAATLATATAASAASAGQSDADYINQLYQSILGRAADAAGTAYWSGLLGGGAASRADVEAAFRSSAEAMALPRFALGGLARTPSIFGEDGIELALPLEKPARLRELLTQYGGMLTAAAGGPEVVASSMLGAERLDATNPGYQAPPAATTAPDNARSDTDLVDAVQALRDAITAVREAAGLRPMTNNIYPTRGEDWYQQLALIDQVVG